MPKYWGKQIFAHGRFPEVGKKKERLNDGNNNGQATHGARMALASRLGQFLEFFARSFLGSLFVYVI